MRDNLLEAFGSSKLVAFSNKTENKIGIYEVETGQEYLTFNGPQLQYSPGETSHVREIPGTTMLISCYHKCFKTANFGVFDVSKKGRVKTIYAFQEAYGREVGQGDIAVNTNRRLIALIPQFKKTAYHLFQIQNTGDKTEILLVRKAKWIAKSQDETVSFSMNQEGSRIATLDWRGLCLISDIDTHTCLDSYKSEDRGGFSSKCRWSPIAGDANIFLMKYDCVLNILNLEKNVLTQQKSTKIFKEGEDQRLDGFGFDTCEVDGNLVALSTTRKEVRIFDIRASKIVKSMLIADNSDPEKSGETTSLRWSSCGNLIVIAGEDRVVDVIDLRKEEVIRSFTHQKEASKLTNLYSLSKSL